MTDIEEIKSRIDIVDFLQEYIRLEKSGANWKARCPFHNEKTPSFMVSTDKQIWHCFGGCGEGGDIFSFLMKIEGIEFKEALRILATKAGIKIGNFKEDKKVVDAKKVLNEINEFAAKFFEAQLWANTSNAKKILEYLYKRELKEETIKNFRLGYAPNDWHALEQFLRSKGYSGVEIERAGLAIKSSKGSNEYHDRFRGRIMFSIADARGVVVGFTGRVFEPLFTAEELANQGKYVNSPETEIYNKSLVLYGLNRAKLSLRKQDLCILVEGNMDLIMSHQAGIDNTVAVSGTALTDKQLAVIKRYTDNLALAFDSDEAGSSATKRSTDSATEKGFNIKIITIDGAKDPADIIKDEGGVEKWKDMVGNAKSIAEFYFMDAFSKFSVDSAEGKRKIAEMLLPVIKKNKSQVEKHHWIHVLAERLGTKEDFLIEALRDLKSEKVYSSSGQVDGDKKNDSRPVLDELGERLLGLIVLYYEKEIGSIDFPSGLSFVDPKVATIYETLIKGKSSAVGLKELYEKFSSDDNDFLKKLGFIAEKQWIDSEEDISAIKGDIEFLLNKIKARNIKQDLGTLAQNIRLAEQDGDRERVNLLKEEFKKIAEKLT